MSGIGSYSSPSGANPGGAVPVQVSSKRWRHLILGVICMIMIANLQYGWTLFVLPLHNAHGWTIASIQISFSLFIALETWPTPIDGWIADTLGPDLGPRVVMGAGGILVALGWILDSYAQSLIVLYLGGALGGLGAGAVYTTAVGNAVKWFKDRRGLAVGLTAAGFGAGSALTIIPIRIVIASYGYSATFFWFGLIQGLIVLLVAQFIRAPRPGEAPAVAEVKVHQTKRSHSPREMLSTPIFWVLYLLFLMMAAGGLMAAANIAAIAKSFGVSNVAIIGAATALSVALIFANIMNGAARPFFGWVSDHIGHTSTMAIAFGLGAVGYFLLSRVGHSPWAFVIFTGLIFLCWGEIFSLFPAMCTDLFGPKYATTNLSFLYTSKGVAGFLVPLASLVVRATHNWSSLLLLTTAINVVAVAIVVLILRPVEKRYHASDDLSMAPQRAAE